MRIISKFNFLYILPYFISCIICHLPYVKFPFTRNISFIPLLKGKELLKKMDYNNIYTHFKVGEPPQDIPISIKMSSYPFYIVDKSDNISNCEIKFDKQYSKSLKSYSTQPKNQFELEDFLIAEKVNDTIKLTDNTNLGTFDFFLVKKMSNLQNKGYEYVSGCIGVKIYDNNLVPRGPEQIRKMDMDTGILHLLKKNNIISNSSNTMTIKYNDKYNGELIIGKYPHEYDTENYSKDNLIYTKAYLTTDYSFDLKFDYVYYGDINLLGTDTSILMILKIEQGLIHAPNVYRDIVTKEFFEQYINSSICEKVILDWDKHFSFICDTNIDLSKFKPLYIGLKEYTYKFSLDANDLFFKEKDKYYFKVVFSSYSLLVWELGEPFFSKYPLIFDSDKRIVAYYTKKGKEKNINNNNMGWILFFFSLAFIIIMYIVYVKYIKPRIKRTNKANELEDNYSYMANKENNKENKLIYN